MNIDQLQFDCLYYYVRQGNLGSQLFDNQIDSNVHMTDYCLRPSDEISVLTPHFLNLRDANFTFEQLRHLNITVDILFSWSASIDLMEQYQLFIDQAITNFSSSSQIFYNCTRPWFGSLCQYTFDYRIGMAFVDVVRRMFEDKLDANNDIGDRSSNLTCYTHLTCDRGAPLCLDWREVCNGRFDCIDGDGDEAQCFSLELNECAENEYRCRNGLCIPKEFHLDDPTNPDCLDGTDEEQSSNSYAVFCPKDPTFRCEELSCRFGERDFACGDGTCVTYYDKCINKRDILLKRRLLSRGKLPNICRLVMVCFAQITPELSEKSCSVFKNNSAIISYLSTCKNLFQFPTISIAFDHVGSFYNNNYSKLMSNDLSQVLHPYYVRCDIQKCDSIVPTFYYQNLTCRYRHELNFTDHLDYDDIISYVEFYFRNCLTIHFTENFNYEQHPSLYCCKNSSKCISKHRLLDKIKDCYLGDDEDYKMNISSEDEYRSIDMFSMKQNQTKISFQKICNGIQDLLPEIINNQNHTDETECEDWPCNNIYTRCDTHWACSNGQDESDCISSNCPSGTRPCVSPTNFILTCLPISRVSNGIIDCIGALDEPKYCRGPSSIQQNTGGFRCWNDSRCLNFQHLCDGKKTCRFGDDEKFCGNSKKICYREWTNNRTEIEDTLCQLFEIGKKAIVFFSLKTSATYPLLVNNTFLQTDSSSIKNETITHYVKIRSYNPKVKLRCNRGIYARLWLGGKDYNYRCFCPPSYYGKMCQYQNQRVSLTLRLLPVNRYSIYDIVVTLIDDNYEINSYQQFVFLSGWGCKMKFNNYLLYSSRLKNILKNYSVHIDIFDKTSMIYYASWKLTIQFLFLPVNRLVAQLNIPVRPVEIAHSCNLMCKNNGRCMKYVNTEEFFCQCIGNWSGNLCDIPANCADCSFGSICAGSIKNRSICICPISKFGPRCILTGCTPGFCQNNGQCVVVDGRSTKKTFSCVCLDEFYGTKCEYRKRRLEISFDKMASPSYILLYVVIVSNNSIPNTIVLFKKLKHNQPIVTFNILEQFHIVFAKVNLNYYLIVVQQIPRQSIFTSISFTRRCPPIRELLNSTIMSMARIRRVKYYHLSCQNRVDLWCFFDEDYMCLCTLEHHANCFTFNHSTTHECPSKYPCENDALCFQNELTCPLTRTCICNDCYFGPQCQFYAKGIGLTLDDILRYEIQKEKTFSQQPLLVRISAIITMIMFALGLVNGIFSYSTFRRKDSQKVGSGLYLLASSIISFFIVITFTMKYWFLIFSQINLIMNRVVLHWGCILIEPLLKIFLYMNNWLNACVSIERAIAVHKGITFDKTKSKQVAKWIIFIMPVLIIGTFIHEPINRYLFDDEEEQQILCVIHHSEFLKNYNLTITLFHFLTPFLINLFSALFIIIRAARQRTLVRTEKNYKQHLRDQFNIHKHMLISIIILVILSIPRLILSFISDCIRTSRNPRVFLIGYFISLIPSVLIFIVFIVPSPLYKKEFKKAIMCW